MRMKSGKVEDRVKKEETKKKRENLLLFIEVALIKGRIGRSSCGQDQQSAGDVHGHT